MPHPRRIPRETLTALVVEDSLLMREILTESLQGVSGLEVAGVAETAPEALAAFDLHRPDIVVLDLSLREGSGLDLLRQIKERKPSCQVLIFTGHDQASYRQHCLDAGADFFFSKSRQHRDLIRLLHTLADRTRSADVKVAAVGL